MKHFDLILPIKTTMNDLYGDESDHIVCEICGCCKICDDCTCYDKEV